MPASIQVWDLNTSGGDKRTDLAATIQTISNVARVRWRPGHDHHIGSCAMVHDLDVSVATEVQSTVITRLLYFDSGHHVVQSTVIRCLLSLMTLDAMLFRLLVLFTLFDLLHDVRTRFVFRPCSGYRFATWLSYDTHMSASGISDDLPFFSIFIF